MATTVGTLNGHALLRATVTIPKAGIWWADVQVSAPTNDPLTGDASLTLAGQAFQGTILEDGTPYEGRAWYRILGGRAKWRAKIPAKPYRAAGGVKMSSVIKDAANESGETVVFDFEDRKIGPYYARREAEAARVLDFVAPDAWYVDVDGLTHIGTRPPTDWAGKHTVIDKNPSAKHVVIATQDIVGLVPGAKVDGIEAAAIRHELTDDGFRTHIYGAKGISVKTRIRQAFERLVRRIVTEIFYQRSFEYRVVGQNGGYLDLDPVRESDGMPSIRNVPMYVGIPGGRGQPQTGSTVRVSFTNGDPTLPYIVSYDGQANAGWKPTTAGIEASAEVDIFAPSVKLGSSAARAIAHSDEVDAILALILAEYAADVTLLTTPPTSVQFALYAPAKAALLTALQTAISLQIPTLPTINTAAS